MIDHQAFNVDPRNALVVLSGGLDSTILVHRLHLSGAQPLCVTFYYGQKHQVEVELATKTANSLGLRLLVIDLSVLSATLANVCSIIKDSQVTLPKIQDVLGLPQPSTYVPCRNLLFASIAASIAESNGIENVFLGLQSNDVLGYWDTAENFVSALNAVLILNRQHQVTIQAPFIRADKAEEILFAKQHNIPLDNTITCYAGKQPACGICPSCAERIGNFMKAGFIDPIPYATNIDWKDRPIY